MMVPAVVAVPSPQLMVGAIPVATAEESADVNVATSGDHARPWMAETATPVRFSMLLAVVASSLRSSRCSTHGL